MSEIFLDTETTGLSFREGHKIVEIACIETNDLIPTNNVFHKLINPRRSMPKEAFNDFLKYSFSYVKTHVSPDSKNIEILLNKGIKKILLVYRDPRDPRDIAISQYYHIYKNNPRIYS